MESKIIPFYLPQFHEIPENNLWWGQGFTDWVNVKKAKPFYQSHNQPRVPHPTWLGYYDLSDEKIIIKQIELAKLFKIHGFCFYYYNFGYNKKLLDKPINNFIKNNIDFNFCLCWVNTSWKKTWTGTNQLLISQNYDIQDQEYIFDDLLNTSKDKRYIRLNDKPLLVIYNINDIPKQLLNKFVNNFSIFIINTNTFYDKNYISGVIDWPTYELRQNTQYDIIKKEFSGRVVDYDLFTNQI
jgi:hypothetical protein